LALRLSVDPTYLDQSRTGRSRGQIELGTDIPSLSRQNRTAMVTADGVLSPSESQRLSDSARQVVIDRLLNHDL
jgi:hypothetical protein